MGEDSQPLVRAVDMGKRYGEFVALHPLNVEVHSGEFFGVFGPQWCWKINLHQALDRATPTVNRTNPGVGR